MFDLESQKYDSAEIKVRGIFKVDENQAKTFQGIEFKDVTFAYENRPDVKILKKLSLRIEPGNN